MNDEQFKNFLSLIAYQHGLGYWGEQLLARDTAQCEALARVEQQRDDAQEAALSACTAVNRLTDELDVAEAQLAEAVRLLKALNDNPSYADHVRADDFLARHAQTEKPCQTCEPAGLFATDGAGPYDCYACGKKAENFQDKV